MEGVQPLDALLLGNALLMPGDVWGTDKPGPSFHINVDTGVPVLRLEDGLSPFDWLAEWTDVAP